MAKQLDIFPTMLGLVVLFLLLVPSRAQGPIPEPGVAQEGMAMTAASTSADPWFGQKLPPQPYKGFYVYVRKCMEILTAKCGQQIFQSIFSSNEVESTCCMNLQTMGTKCHKGMAWTLAHIEKFKPQAQLIYQRSDQIYSECSRRNS